MGEWRGEPSVERIMNHEIESQEKKGRTTLASGARVALLTLLYLVVFGLGIMAGRYSVWYQIQQAFSGAGAAMQNDPEIKALEESLDEDMAELRLLQDELRGM